MRTASRFYQGKPFEPGKDDLLRKPSAGGGYVVAMGEAVYRALDAVIASQGEGRRRRVSSTSRR